MEILLFLLIVLAGYHLFIEQVFIPYWEDKLQDELYPVIKKVSGIYESAERSETKEVAKELMDSILKTTLTLRHHNFVEFSLWFVKANHRNKRTDVQRRTLYEKAFEQSPKLNEAYTEYIGLIKKAFVNNMTGWFIYVLPFVLVWNIGKKVVGKFLFIKNSKSWKPASKKFQRYQLYEAKNRKDFPDELEERMVQVLCT